MISVGDFELVYDPLVGADEAWYINDHTVYRDRTGVWHLIGIIHAEPMAPFDLANQVATMDAHAAEVIVDERGDGG